MKKKDTNNLFENIPGCAAEFIKLVIRKMRYRKKVRADVQAELVNHFEDALKDCAGKQEREERAQKLIEDFGDAKLLGVLARRAKKRCRPLWRTAVVRTFQTIGVLIICFILYCVYISFGKPNITVNYVAKMNSLAKPVADENLNAALLYDKAIELYKKEPVIEQNSKKKDLLDVIRHKNTIEELNNEELSLLQCWIDDNAEANELFKQASEKPHCWWKREAEDSAVTAILLPELSNMRRFVKLLCWQAKLKADNGQLDEAFDDLLTCYRAGQHLKGPGVLVEQLVGMAMQALAVKDTFVILDTQKISIQLLKDFQAKLEDLIAKGTYVMCYDAERFFVLDFVQRCYTDNGRGSGHLIPVRVRDFWFDVTDEQPMDEVFDYGRFLAIALVSVDRRKMTGMFGNAYDNFQKWANKTPWQVREENIDTTMGFYKLPLWKQARYWPFWMLVPAIARANTLSYRIKIDSEGLVATIALLRYGQDTGVYPESLAELVKAGYTEEVPMDPFSDKSLVYRKTDDGFLLYSVGENFIDDGGKSGKDKNGRIKKWTDNGDAVFWPIAK